MALFGIRPEIPNIDNHAITENFSRTSRRVWSGFSIEHAGGALMTFSRGAYGGCTMVLTPDSPLSAETFEAATTTAMSTPHPLLL